MMVLDPTSSESESEQFKSAISHQHNNVIKRVLHLLSQKAPKLACFVLYLKIINIFLKNNICIL